MIYHRNITIWLALCERVCYTVYMNNTPNKLAKCEGVDCANLTDIVLCDDCTDKYLYDYELARDDRYEARLS